ncbi:MAG TPA: mechanosensitive ion channel family protein [Candidatus Eisenbacteria bacterium]|nr:mechanosensitive ion channel family protein [Candidatus Eisenbacteria bacterium]
MFEQNLDWPQIRTIILTHGLKIAVILLVAIVGYRIIKGISLRFEKSVQDEDPLLHSESEKRAETLGRVIRQVSLVTVGIIAGMGILRELGFDVGPLIAGAGIAGLAVGFGAQNLVRDIITGFFIIFENQIRVGDVVEVAGKTGKVEQVSLRTTVLRGSDGSVHVVPNGQITTVTNMTREWSQVVLDVSIDYKEDMNRVLEVLKNAGQELAEDPGWRTRVLEPLTILGVNALSSNAVEVQVTLKTAPGAQFEVGRELRRRIKDSFDGAGIRIPGPQTTLVMSRPLDAPPIPRS